MLRRKAVPRPMMSTRLSYLICATPRSGGSFLCEVLSSTGIPGRPDDYFWDPPFWFAQWSVTDISSFAERLFQEGTTANGVFGSKLMRDQLDEVVRQFTSLLGQGNAPPPHDEVVRQFASLLGQGNAPPPHDEVVRQFASLLGQGNAPPPQVL